MRYVPLIVAAALFAAPAKADKFWLSDPQAAQNAPEGSSPDYIEGVLIAESDEGYHVRVEGGEVLLPKARVFKVEKDDLTVDALVDAEKAAKAVNARADEARRLNQELAQKEREVRVAEAAARRSARAVDASLTTEAAPMPRGGARFDPVVGVVRGESSHAAMLRDAQLAWTLTKDRRYLKLLRQLRRLR